jgi:hypothetical protein
MLMLKRASASRPSGEWSDDDYDVLAGGVVVGRIMRAAASPEGTPWLWTLAFGHHEDRARRRTATRPRARPRWWRSQKASGGNDSKLKISTRNSPSSIC